MELNNLQNQHLSLLENSLDKKKLYLNNYFENINLEMDLLFLQIKLLKKNIQININSNILLTISQNFENKLLYAQELKRIDDWINEEIKNDIKDQKNLIEKLKIVVQKLTSEI